MLEDRGKFEEAGQTFDRARSILNKLIADFPDQFSFRNVLASLEARRRLSIGVARVLAAFERFIEQVGPLLRSRPMWPMISSLSRLAHGGLEPFAPVDWPWSAWRCVPCSPPPSSS